MGTQKEELKSKLAEQKQGFENKLAQQQKQIEALTVGLQGLSEQIDFRKSASQVAANDN